MFIYLSVYWNSMPTIANPKWKLKREKTTTGREYEAITELFNIITVQQLFSLMFLGYLKKNLSSNSLCLLTLSKYSIWSLLWLILPTNTISSNSPCKNMPFILIVLVGNCVAFFLPGWVIYTYRSLDLPHATHGACQANGDIMLYLWLLYLHFERPELDSRVYQSLKLVFCLSSQANNFICNNFFLL